MAGRHAVQPAEFHIAMPAQKPGAWKLNGIGIGMGAAAVAGDRLGPISNCPPRPLPRWSRASQSQSMNSQFQ